MKYDAVTEKRTAVTDTQVKEPLVMSSDELAHLGDGRLAYVKVIASEDVKKMFPQAPELEPGIKLFSLHGADGTPMMLTDSRESAVANAWSHELETVSVH